MLAGSRHPVHMLSVTGKESGPIVLVVSAYEPILWDLSAVSDRVKAVVASGYYPQAVRGITPGTPVRFASSVGKFEGSETCAHVRYSYDRADDIKSVADDIKKAIGVHPRAFYGNYSTSSFDVDGLVEGPQSGEGFSDIRAGVPLITADDPASSARMKALPPSNGERRPRVVEWNSVGKVIRDEGGREGASAIDATSAFAASTPSRPYGRRASFSGISLLYLMALAMVGYFAWQWRRSKRFAAKPPMEQVTRPHVVSPSTAHGSAPATITATSFQKHFADLTALAAVTDCEPLVVVLHRYGREVQNLGHITFDPDLAEEAEAIVERHFNHAAHRYKIVRSSLDREEGARADASLTRAIERLAFRLQGLQLQQHHRDVDSVDEAARFIDARHPV